MTGRPGLRRATVPILLALGAVVAVTLILTGRRGSRTPSATGRSPSTTASPVLHWLGAFSDSAGLQAAVRKLDLSSLAPPAGSPAAPAGAPTRAAADRCAGAVSKASDDPVGELLASAGAELAGSPTLVLTYRLPATPAHGAGVRTFGVDGVSCRPLFAIDKVA